MKKIRLALLILSGLLLLIVGAAGTFFYFKVYRPIGAPLMAIAGAKTLEDRKLQQHGPFEAPSSGELTGDQTSRFVDVEEAVRKQLGTGMAFLAQGRADLEGARDGRTVPVKATLAAFGSVRRVFLDAKVTQIDAMNRANFSKAEFEWIRRQLYSAASLPLSQLDATELTAGVPDAMVVIREFTPEGALPANQRLARPLASKLQEWAVLAFFGL